MSGADRPVHAVLVRSSEKFSPVVVAGVLAKSSGRPALDFVQGVKRGWGVVVESVPAAEADALAAALSAAGQESVAVPSSLLEAPPAPVPVGKADFGSEGFDVVSGRENTPPERLPWRRLAAVCAGAVEIRGTTTVTESVGPSVKEQAVRLGLTMATGLPLMKARSEVKREVATVDRALAVDLHFLEPARRLRVEARAFDFSALGDRMTYAAESNFTVLLEELVARAPKALRGKGTRALLARRPRSEYSYDSFDDLTAEGRWLAALVALKAAL